jgi:hypothetical protein
MAWGEKDARRLLLYYPVLIRQIRGRSLRRGDSQKLTLLVLRLREIVVVCSES